MILYNITVSIDYNVHQEWLIWMKEVHIPTSPTFLDLF